MTENLQKFFWMAKSCSFVMIGFVCACFIGIRFLSRGLTGPGAPQAEPLVIYLFYAMGLIQIAISGPVKSLLLSPRLSKITREQGAALEGSRARQIFSAHITSYAVCEAGAIICVVTVFIGGQELYAYGLCLLALGAMLFHFPKMDQWE